MKTTPKKSTATIKRKKPVTRAKTSAKKKPTSSKKVHFLLRPLKHLSSRGYIKVPRNRKKLLSIVGFIIVFGAIGSYLLVFSKASTTNTLHAGQTLYAGQALDSGNGIRLVMQTDGNLVIYDGVGKAVWSNEKYGTGSNNRLVMQTDGNLVEYTSSNQVVWHIGKNGTGSNNRLVMQTDGNLVIYTNTNQVVWHTNTRAVNAPQRPPSTNNGDARRIYSPQGYADYCEFKNGRTMIYGWAHDADNQYGPQVKLTINVNGVQKEAGTATTIFDYRAPQVESFIKSQGIPLSSYKKYGWAYNVYNQTDLKRGRTVKLSGILTNANQGVETGLGINTGGGVDGSSRPFFANGNIPDVCLAP
jgi:hypothetical protein